MPESPAVQPPGLELGDGERRDDCRHYPACLAAYCAERRGRWDLPARCPEGCEAFEEIPVAARVEAGSPRDGRAEWERW